MNHEDAERGFHPACCAQEMTGHGLGRAHRDLEGSFTQHALNGLAFHLIRKGGRRMRIDVSDLLLGDAGVLDRRFHAADCPLAIIRRRGNVVGITVHAIADQLTVDTGAAIPGCLIFLAHQPAGSFSEDKTIPVSVKGPARSDGIVIASGQSFR